jgi:signal transduction histidine kinase
MKSLVERIISVAMAFVDSFIPAGVEYRADQIRDFRVFLISHVFGPFLGSSVPIALYLLDPTPDYTVAVLALSIWAFWIFPPLLKAFGHYEVLVLVSVQNLNFCILWSCFFYGGVASPTLPWVLVIPLLGFFYLGSSARMRLIVLGQFALNVVAFSLLYTIMPPAGHDLPEAAVQFLGLTSTAAASIYVAMMAVYYARVLSGQAELESEMAAHKATASQMRNATRQAERASAAKAEFVARMSHELRTPLNAIIGYSDLLIEEATDEGDGESIEVLQRIRRSGTQLLTIVNNVLDLSKIDAGKMEIHRENGDVDRLIDDVIAASRPEAERRNIALGRTPGVTIGAQFVDVQKLRQVVDHLVKNAVKFTERGSVSILGELIDKGQQPILSIKVIDTGIGIPAKDLPVLFERFNVIQDVTTSKYGGTGLGLALAHRLVALMGGTLTVESKAGIGSSFAIVIPLVAQSAARVAPTPTAAAIALAA